MKKIQKWCQSPFLLIWCLALSGCPSFQEPPTAISGEKGYVLVNPVAQRTLLPDDRDVCFQLNFVPLGEPSWRQELSVFYTSGGSVEIDSGVWTLTIRGYMGAAVNVTAETRPFAEVVRQITVIAGETVEVRVTLEASITGSAGETGTFSYEVDFGDLSDTLFGQLSGAVLRLEPLGGVPVDINLLDETLHPEFAEYRTARRSILLSPGIYYLTIKLSRGEGRQTAGFFDVVYIYRDMETKAGSTTSPIVFLDSNFSEKIYLEGSTGSYPGYTAQRVRITAPDGEILNAQTDIAGRWKAAVNANFAGSQADYYFQTELIRSDYTPSGENPEPDLFYSKPERQTITITGNTNLVLSRSLYSLQGQVTLDGVPPATGKPGNISWSAQSVLAGEPIEVTVTTTAGYRLSAAVGNLAFTWKPSSAAQPNRNPDEAAIQLSDDDKTDAGVTRTYTGFTIAHAPMGDITLTADFALMTPISGTEGLADLFTGLTGTSPENPYVLSLDGASLGALNPTEAADMETLIEAIRDALPADVYISLDMSQIPMTTWPAIAASAEEDGWDKTEGIISVILPDTLTTLAVGAFAGYSGLREVTVLRYAPGNPTENSVVNPVLTNLTAAGVFTGCSNDLVIWVPGQGLTDYMSAADGDGVAQADKDFYKGRLNAKYLPGPQAVRFLNGTAAESVYISNTYNSITIGWDPAEGYGSYELILTTNETAPAETIPALAAVETFDGSGPNPDFEKLIAGLTPNSSYYGWVRTRGVDLEHTLVSPWIPAQVGNATRIRTRDNNTGLASLQVFSYAGTNLTGTTGLITGGSPADTQTFTLEVPYAVTSVTVNAAGPTGTNAAVSPVTQTIDVSGGSGQATVTVTPETVAPAEGTVAPKTYTVNIYRRSQTGISVAVNMVNGKLTISPAGAQTIYKDGNDATIYKKTLTVTMTGEGYSGFSWYVDTVQITGNTNTITIDAANFARSGHKLVVRATRAGVPYSQDIPFTVALLADLE
jgi:hypothetical protein